MFGTLSPTHCTFSDIIAGPVSTRTHCIPLPARRSGLAFTPPVFAASHTILVRGRHGSCSTAFNCLYAHTVIWPWQWSRPRRIRPAHWCSRIYQHRQIYTVALDAPMLWHTVFHRELPVQASMGSSVPVRSHAKHCMQLHVPVEASIGSSGLAALKSCPAWRARTHVSWYVLVRSCVRACVCTKYSIREDV